MESEHSLVKKHDANYILNNKKHNSSSGHKNSQIAAMVSLKIESDAADGCFEKKCKSYASQVPSVASSLSFATNSGASNVHTNSSSNSPKMGSRRIFTPQFKIQVLESYRNDNDCKGNQRATARKYNIHRRQIQKWLQCESNLRSSVANINQNNVKHQFHNISHHHHHQQQLQAAAATNNNNNSNGAFGRHHHAHHLSHQQHQLPLDTARQSVALNSLAAGVGTPSASTAQEVLAAANLAAVVAAAAAAGAAGAMAIASTATTNTSTTPASPLRPTAIGGSNSAATISPVGLLPPHHHHHHHHQQHQLHHYYPLPHTHTPASAPITVPILTHHIPPQHLHHHYQYHNLSPHPHSLPQIQQPSAFVPSVCLPVNVLTAATPNGCALELRAGARERVEEENRTSAELREPTTSATTTKADTSATRTGNSYVLSDEYAYMYKCTANGGENGGRHDAKYKNLQQSPFEGPSAAAITPMDLSLGPRRESRVTKHVDDVAHEINENAVVDLTFRKRKVVTANPTAHEQPEKLSKRTIKTEASDDPSKEIDYYVDVEEEAEADADADADADTEANTDEKLSSPSKTVKLFKPYLLDDEANDSEDKRHSKTSNPKFPEANASEQRQSIIWSNYPSCLSPLDSYDGSRGSNFQSASTERYTFLSGSPHFPGAKSSSCSQSALSPSSAPAMSPTSLRSPKGSPVSGYESSSSVYSESSCRSLSHSGAFSLNIQMQTVYNDNLMRQQTHVQRWLDQETNQNPPTTGASIALYA